MISKGKQMGKFTEIKVHDPSDTRPNFLRISTHGKKLRIKTSLQILRFIDADTNQYVSYIPSIEISGYGDTERKSMEMLESAIDATFEYWCALSVKDLHKELGVLGWKQNKLKHKEYSNSFVDKDGNLNGVINAVDNKVEYGLLTA